MGSLALPFSDCSFRSPHFTPLCPVRRPSSSQAAQLVRSWGLGGETRHLQSPQAFKDCKAPSIGCRILRLQVARGVHECAYMPHRYFICTCKTITTRPGVSGDGGLWAGGRRAYQSGQPDPPSERVAVAFPSSPRTPLSSLRLLWIRCWECTRPKNGPMQVGDGSACPPLQTFDNHMALMRGAARSEGQKYLGWRAARPHNIFALLPLTGSLPPVGRMRLFLAMPSLSGKPRNPSALFSS
ncbi:hypothetical protein B0T18DRAFT_411137 [Schizothecium vesticola]|uniref:Uncharacterized protein n=1 Tax=Schizothecium vesticola TaxID=314040 RepID=A0AA40K533_9PEZI|nr:hypothetical protein B0T18DRAFT_411137 [Schizothecium vesticola]